MTVTVRRALDHSAYATTFREPYGPMPGSPCTWTGVKGLVVDVFLFNGTVRENILYGRPGATDEEVVAAAQAANAQEFIVDLPDGYDTQIRERGLNLSGGQKQRLSIARAVLKDTPSSSSTRRPRRWTRRPRSSSSRPLERLIKNRTTVVISHRLSTVQNADRIIVLQDGRIVETVRHAELIEGDGLYARLCRAQSTTDLGPAAASALR